MDFKLARESRKQTEKKHSSLMTDKKTRNIFRQLSNMIGGASLTLYGTDRVSDIDSLNQTFNDLLKNELESITGKVEGDATSFLSKLNSQNRKQTAMEDIINAEFAATANGEGSTLQSFIFEAYKNRLVEQNDLHEIASQLIELSEAISITRDAIISPDVVEGRMNRTIDFTDVDKDDLTDYIPLVEHMEKKFKLLEKIKNFIIPKTLEYGEYYAYTIPYSVIFNDFLKSGVTTNDGQRIMYKESTLLDYLNTTDEKIFTESASSDGKPPKKIKYAEKIYNEYCEEIEKRNAGKAKSAHDASLESMGVPFQESAPDKETFIKDIENILGNISICNDSVPLPFFEEGAESLSYLRQHYVNESGDTLLKEANFKPLPTSKEKGDKFNQVLRSSTPDGITYTQDSNEKEVSKDLENIADCYIKLIDPTKIVPIKILTTTVGYYYIESTDIAPLSGAVSSNLYYTKFDETSREQTIVDSISRAIVSAFNKDFLKENEKFKKTIAEAIQYYNLNNKRIKFQYIPVEYMQVFKIDENEKGDGQSMIKKALFYAKLYLMLLLFKIMSIIMNSNDTKVNYLKQSGIDKNIANKVQEIARIRQSRQINIYDLFNYTTLINKVGSGSEMYIPTGRSGERPIETEILSGQDVQLNSDLLEMLKNAYILATGVPAAIINYLNEADFAKSIEQQNSKFNGRVVNYQLDFNPSITEWYQKIMGWSTQIPENIITNFKFILQPPKTASGVAKGEAINNFQTYSDFCTKIIYGDNNNGEVDQKEILHFVKKLADDQLPLLNIEKLEEFAKEAKLQATQESLTPNANSGDSGDDIGIEGLENISI